MLNPTLIFQTTDRNHKHTVWPLICVVIRTLTSQFTSQQSVADLGLYIFSIILFFICLWVQQLLIYIELSKCYYYLFDRLFIPLEWERFYYG